MFVYWFPSNPYTINIGKGFAGVKTGYRVSLHAKPKYVFLVEAESGEQAVDLAVRAAKVNSDAATYQRIA